MIVKLEDKELDYLDVADKLNDLCNDEVLIVQTLVCSMVIMVHDETVTILFDNEVQSFNIDKREEELNYLIGSAVIKQIVDKPLNMMTISFD